MGPPKSSGFRPFQDPVPSIQMETESIPDSVENAEVEHPSSPAVSDNEFIKVDRRQKRLKAFIPVLAFGKEETSMNTRRTLLGQTYKGVVAPISAPTIRWLRLDDNEPERCFVVEVGYRSQMDTLLRCNK
ncbi:hypothetical protein BGW38_009978, partial [Lunasporangiospora selenospora]